MLLRRVFETLVSTVSGAANFLQFVLIVLVMLHEPNKPKSTKLLPKSLERKQKQRRKSDFSQALFVFCLAVEAYFFFILASKPLDCHFLTKMFVAIVCLLTNNLFGSTIICKLAKQVCHIRTDRRTNTS